MDTQHSSTKAILYAFLANLGIAISKGTGALITGSGSMLAETIHSFADCGNQLLLFLGLKSAQKPADNEHPLGYGKATYFWSFIVAIILFSLGGLFSIFEGYEKIHKPEELSHPYVAVGILVVSFLLEGSSLFGAIKEIKRIKGNKTLLHWLSSTRKSELLVVFGEDLGAIAGLFFALIFLGLTVVTGKPVYDAIGSIVIGTILLIISYFLMTRVHALLIGQSADPELVGFMEEEIKKDKNIVELYNLITLQIGPDIMLSAKIQMKKGLSIDLACQKINKLEVNLKKKFPEIRWCFIEPDIKK